MGKEGRALVFTDINKCKQIVQPDPNLDPTTCQTVAATFPLKYLEDGHDGAITLVLEVEDRLNPCIFHLVRPTSFTGAMVMLPVAVSHIERLS